MRAFVTAFFLLVTAGSWPSPAFAQTSRAHPPHATALQGGAGVAVDSTIADPWIGGAASWQLSHQFRIAGSFLWQNREGDNTGFGGDVALELALAPEQNHVKPFVRLGIGAYRASFRATPLDGTAPEEPPDFYARRMDSGRTVFTDPSVIVGFGFELRVARHVTMRPDARMTWVVADGRAHPMAFVGLHLGYEFEHHPVTPSRR
jgi:hypothetical protein